MKYDFGSNAPNGSNGTDFPKMLIHPDCVQGSTSNCSQISVKYGQGQQTVVNRNNVLHMWWHDDTVFDPPSRRYKLKYATSVDGVNFSAPETIYAPGDFGNGVWGGSSNVVWNGIKKEFVLFTAHHRDQNTDNRGLYLTSPDGVNWSGTNIFVDTDIIPPEANNPGVSFDILGDLIPDHFLFGINDKYNVYQGKLYLANVGVNLPAMSNNTLSLSGAANYVTGGWTESPNMFAINNGATIKIGLKASAAFKTGEMKGYSFSVPQDNSWVKIAFDWKTNYDNKYFYAAMDIPGTHAFWKSDVYGYNTGRAEVWLPRVGFLGFGLFSKGNYTYPYLDNQWDFEISNVVISYVGSVPTSTPYSHCSPLGDIDCSAHVNSLDFSVLFSDFGHNVNTNPEAAKSDLDDSKNVDMHDLFTLLKNFGK